jgi:hypothetical protein
MYTVTKPIMYVRQPTYQALQQCSKLQKAQQRSKVRLCCCAFQVHTSQFMCPYAHQAHTDKELSALMRVNMLERRTRMAASVPLRAREVVAVLETYVSTCRLAAQVAPTPFIEKVFTSIMCTLQVVLVHRPAVQQASSEHIHACLEQCFRRVHEEHTQRSHLFNPHHAHQRPCETAVWTCTCRARQLLLHHRWQPGVRSPVQASQASLDQCEAKRPV